jgi:23S rRNA (guanosine2251-2'-O)-methyltransferase
MNIEGKNAVREAILSNKPMEKLLASNQVHDKVFNEIVELAKTHKIKVQFMPQEAMNKQSVTKNHQGLIAITGSYSYFSVEDILRTAKDLEQDPLILILDEINDPHNFGSMIRVCECLGVHGIIIAKDRACPVNETVLKVSAGATNYVKVAKVTNINREIENLKQLGVWVYALELGGGDITNANLTGPLAIVVGSEGKGVSQLTKKLCDGVVTIPMYGKVNSLNASVACGISLYEVVKQRNK